MISTGRKKAGKIKALSGEFFHGKSFAPFDNQEGLKYNGSVAGCQIDQADGDNIYVPWLTLSDFGFNIPPTASVREIKVYYNHRQEGCSIPAPVISTSVDGTVGMGTIPPRDFKAEVLTLTNYDLALSEVNPAEFNSKDFSLDIYYDKNSGSAGTFQIKDIEVEVLYYEGGFHFETSQMPDGVLYPGHNFDFVLTLANDGSYADAQVDVLIETTGFLDVVPNKSVKQLDDGTFHWYPKFDSATVTRKISCKPMFFPRSAGEHTVRVTELAHNTSRDYTFTVDNNYTFIQSGIPESMVLGTDYLVAVNNINLEANERPRQCKIVLPPSFDIEEYGTIRDGEATLTKTDTETSILWNIPAEVDNAELDFLITAYSQGNHTYTIFDEHNALIYGSTINVIPAEYTEPYFAKYELTDDTFDLMADEIRYSALSFIKLIPTVNIDDAYEYYEDFLKNYRFHVSHMAGDDKSQIDSAVSSEFIPISNEWFLSELQFTYHEGSPVTLYWSGDYLQRDTSLINIEFSTPIIMETEYLHRNNKQLEGYGNYPKPLKGLLRDDGGNVKVGVVKSSNNFRTSAMDMQNIDKTPYFAFQGLVIKFDYESTGQAGVNAKLINLSNGQYGQRSTMIHEGKGTGKIGGVFDLFGLKYSEIPNIEALETEFNIFNPTSEGVEVHISNIRFEFTWSTLDNTEWTEFWINGETSRYYNCFLRDLTIKGGTDTDVEVFNVDGTDEHTAYRQSIDTKEIEVEFTIDSCKFEDSTALFERASRWFANNRDKYNRPIENIIEFAHIPDMQFKYVMEDAIDEKVVEGGDYECKVKLLIPSGTMESKNTILTNHIGYNDSIAKVSPKIMILARGAGDFTITEENSGQVFSLEEYSVESEDLLRIDCKQRTVTHMKKTLNGYVEYDITKAVDFDSDWFVLFPKSEYNFTVKGGVFQSIEFKERW